MSGAQRTTHYCSITSSAIFKALRHKVIEAPVTIEYPKTDGIAYTKMRAITDWWKIFRPIIFLAFGIKR